ncbi:hypothetical protein L6452_00134 [Arctium lappa]|uniref:Uncharacterized protein n=1 Tax=Arctium lappa TaxID=4217 RepID=A0ACB9FE21_ARCLA|nr:hypothetical protein L6452_00134 [Arctium lappa]
MIISTSSYDGKVGIYNIEACARYGIGESYLVSAPLRSPKWYQRKAGVTFGFGGKLVSFHSTGSSLGRSEVNVRALVTEHNLVSTSSEFEAAMKSGELSLLRLLCDKKYQESDEDAKKELEVLWRRLDELIIDGIMQAMLLDELKRDLAS